MRWSYWNIFLRLSIARFCFSRNVVYRFLRFLGGVGYIIQGVLMVVVVSLMTMMLGVSCNWTG